MADTGLSITKEFITIGKELAGLSDLVRPTYRSCAADLYLICKKLLEANENIVRWFNKFLYFDFTSPNASFEFKKAAADYDTMKRGHELRKLKFSCTDIENIYQKNIGKKIGSWFSNKKKVLKAQSIFSNLSSSDGQMILFLEDTLIPLLDKFVLKMEVSVSKKNFNAAERTRLKFRKESKPLVDLISDFNDELTELVITFAKMSNTPITLINAEK